MPHVLLPGRAVVGGQRLQSVARSFRQHSSLVARLAPSGVAPQSPDPVRASRGAGPSGRCDICGDRPGFTARPTEPGATLMRVAAVVVVLLSVRPAVQVAFLLAGDLMRWLS